MVDTKLKHFKSKSISYVNSNRVEMKDIKWKDIEIIIVIILQLNVHYVWLDLILEYIFKM